MSAWGRVGARVPPPLRRRRRRCTGLAVFARRGLGRLRGVARMPTRACLCACVRVRPQKTDMSKVDHMDVTLYDHNSGLLSRACHRARVCAWAVDRD